jgi:hypothetical protein
MEVRDLRAGSAAAERCVKSLLPPVSMGAQGENL